VLYFNYSFLLSDLCRLKMSEGEGKPILGETNSATNHGAINHAADHFPPPSPQAADFDSASIDTTEDNIHIRHQENQLSASRNAAQHLNT
jgi:hypothetical protein